MSLSTAEDGRPVVLDTDHRPSFGVGALDCLFGAGGVVELPLGVVVHDEESQRSLSFGAGEAEHRHVAVGIATGEYWTAADAAPDAHGLGRPVVEELHLGLVENVAAVVTLLVVER